MVVSDASALASGNGANLKLEPWLHPAAIVGLCLVVFVPLRLCLGGANYLPSRAWYLLCFIIPAFVLAGLASSAFCVPIQADWQTLLHLMAALVYMQLDLCVARLLCSPSSSCADWSLPQLVLSKLSCRPARLDGLSPPGLLPVARSLFELNGALFHEIFWNIFICQNCLNRGLPLPVALLAVPAASCLVHGIVSNINTGVRCLPNFLWVALSFHASGSVLPPALIHAMWYFLEAKLCFSLKTLKRDWDFAERKDECTTPPWDRTCSVGLALVLMFYLPLNVLVSLRPELHSPWMEEPGGCQFIEAFPHLPNRVNCSLLGLGFLQLFLGWWTWGTARAGMEVLAQSGDLTEAGVEAVAIAVEDYAKRHKILASHGADCYSGEDSEHSQESDS
ncbi:unnamed protein product [Polarella glacialis]|uniref:Uncharacterized protein n=1 Tax=Polarella glacialis TaxID=89957 RepID=A0A813H6A9_POLGL|nr:unnamed protein product [Polarella glacialis]